jgi:hypothetical protein
MILRVAVDRDRFRGHQRPAVLHREFIHATMEVSLGLNHDGMITTHNTECVPRDIVVAATC